MKIETYRKNLMNAAADRAKLIGAIEALKLTPMLTWEGEKTIQELYLHVDNLTRDIERWQQRIAAAPGVGTGSIGTTDMTPGDDAEPGARGSGGRDA